MTTIGVTSRLHRGYVALLRGYIAIFRGYAAHHARKSLPPLGFSARVRPLPYFYLPSTG